MPGVKTGPVPLQKPWCPLGILESPTYKDPQLRTKAFILDILAALFDRGCLHVQVNMFVVTHHGLQRARLYAASCSLKSMLHTFGNAVTFCCLGVFRTNELSGLDFAVKLRWDVRAETVAHISYRTTIVTRDW